MDARFQAARAITPRPAVQLSLPRRPLPRSQRPRRDSAKAKRCAVYMRVGRKCAQRLHPFAIAHRCPVHGRDVAQPGSASHWGCGGRWFESSRPDQIFPASGEQVLLTSIHSHHSVEPMGLPGGFLRQQPPCMQKPPLRACAERGFGSPSKARPADQPLSAFTSTSAFGLLALPVRTRAGSTFSP